MKRVPFFSGNIRCTECRQQWGTTWNTHAPKLICHDCGGACLPVGPQVAAEPSIDAALFRLWMQQRRAAMS